MNRAGGSSYKNTKERQWLAKQKNIENIDITDENAQMKHTIIVAENSKAHVAANKTLTWVGFYPSWDFPDKSIYTDLGHEENWKAYNECLKSCKT